MQPIHVHVCDFAPIILMYKTYWYIYSMMSRHFFLWLINSTCTYVCKQLTDTVCVYMYVGFLWHCWHQEQVFLKQQLISSPEGYMLESMERRIRALHIFYHQRALFCCHDMGQRVIILLSFLQDYYSKSWTLIFIGRNLPMHK